MALHWDEYPVTPTGELDHEKQALAVMGDVWTEIVAKDNKPRKSFDNVSAAIAQEIQRRSPQQQSYSDSLVCDAMLRLSNLDSMKAPQAEFRDTVTALSEQLRALVPKRQHGCLPQTPAGYAHAIRRSQIFLLGNLSIKFTRSCGRSLIILRRVDR